MFRHNAQSHDQHRQREQDAASDDFSIGQCHNGHGDMSLHYGEQHGQQIDGSGCIDNYHPSEHGLPGLPQALAHFQNSFPQDQPGSFAQQRGLTGALTQQAPAIVFDDGQHSLPGTPGYGSHRSSLSLQDGQFTAMSNAQMPYHLSTAPGAMNTSPILHYSPDNVFEGSSGLDISAPGSEYAYSDGYESGATSQAVSRAASGSPGPMASMQFHGSPQAQQYLLQIPPNSLTRSPQLGGRKRAATQGRVCKSTSTANSTSTGKSSSDVEGENGAKKQRSRKPFDPERRLEVRNMRQTGACFRCRWLKKPCGVGTPCPQCVNVRGRVWTVPCMRVNITDLSGLSDIGLQTKQRTFLNTNILAWSGTEESIGVTHGFHNTDPQSGAQPLQIAVEAVIPLDSQPLTMRWSTANAQEVALGFYWRWYDESSPLNGSSYEAITASYAIRKFQLTENQLDAYLDCDRVVRGTSPISALSEAFQGYGFTKTMMLAAWHYAEISRDTMLKKAFRVYSAVCLQNYLIQSEAGASSRALGQPYARSLAPAFVQVQLELLLDGRRAELEKEVLVELQRMVFSKKRRYWLTIFFTIYLLMATVERSLWNHLAWKTKETICSDFTEGRAQEIAETLVNVFRSINQGSRPLSREVDAEDVMRDVSEAYGHDVVVIFNSIRELIHSAMLLQQKDATFNIHDRFSMECKFTSSLLLA
ncbi:hypothetical protein DFH27DRAFT_602152 [Peziza echinospora]|nr:hypothetical protein DFH27DRAFT_602152 [Peziza echinospora]